MEVVRWYPHGCKRQVLCARIFWGAHALQKAMPFDFHCFLGVVYQACDEVPRCSRVPKRNFINLVFQRAASQVRKVLSLGRGLGLTKICIKVLQYLFYFSRDRVLMHRYSSNGSWWLMMVDSLLDAHFFVNPLCQASRSLEIARSKN